MAEKITCKKENNFNNITRMNNDTMKPMYKPEGTCRFPNPRFASVCKKLRQTSHPICGDSRSNRRHVLQKGCNDTTSQRMHRVKGNVVNQSPKKEFLEDGISHSTVTFVLESRINMEIFIFIFIRTGQ